MPVLSDERHEEFARLVARGWKLAPAYRATHDTKAIPSAIWNMAYLLNREVSVRIKELREGTELEADKDAGIVSNLEALRDLSEVWRQPVESMGPDCQYVQKYRKITDPMSGTITEVIEPLNKLGALAQIASIRGWNAQQPQSLSLHLHNHEAARTNSLEDAAKTLALEFAAASTVIDLEPIHVEQPTPKKTRR